MTNINTPGGVPQARSSQPGHPLTDTAMMGEKPLQPDDTITEALVQRLMQAHIQEAAQHSQPEDSRADRALQTPVAEKMGRGAETGTSPKDQPAKAPARTRKRLVALPAFRPRMPRLPKRLTSWRPTKKQILLALCLLVVVLRPMLVLGLFVLGLSVVLITYLTLGPDRVAEICSAYWHWLAERRPKLAEAIRQRADRFALGWDRMLDWLPETWADRLALPDFSAPFDPDAQDDAPNPFDRLTKEV